MDQKIANKIRILFDILIKAYGKQGWWPTTRSPYKEPKYLAGPKGDKEIFEVMLGAVLTQNTSWNNAKRALCNLIDKGHLDPIKLCKLRKDSLARLIKSAGYYNQKAGTIKRLSRFVVDNPIRELLKKRVSELRDMFLAIKGIGKETADSILLYALGKKIFVIDAYTRRIASRMGICSEALSYDEIRKLFEKALQRRSIKVFNEYHALLVKLGKDVCKKTKPKCDSCPVSAICSYNHSITRVESNNDVNDAG